VIVRGLNSAPGIGVELLCGSWTLGIKQPVAEAQLHELKMPAKLMPAQRHRQARTGGG